MENESKDLVENCEDSCEYKCLCPEYLDEHGNILWQEYFSEYYVAIMSFPENQREECIIPYLFLVSHYFELWAKTIEVNYGMGEGNKIIAKLNEGHKFNDIVTGLYNVLDYDEFYKIEESLDEIFDLYIEIMCSLVNFDENDNLITQLSIAMRYPMTSKGDISINPYFALTVEKECYKFDIGDLLKKTDELVNKTYAVYDKIYNSRLNLDN